MNLREQMATYFWLVEDTRNSSFKRQFEKPEQEEAETPPEPYEEQKLLTEIRDILASKVE